MLALVIVPIFNLASQNLRRLRDDRMRAVATMLGSNVLARLGNRGPELRGLLTHAGEDGELLSDDVLTRPELAVYAKEVGAQDRGVQPLVTAHSLSIVLRLRPRIVPGADLLICEARWKIVVGGMNVEDRATFERLLVDDTL